MKRFLSSMVGLLAAVAGLFGPTPVAEAAPSCTLQIKVLPMVAGPRGDLTSVNGLSDYSSMSVGSSAGIPVYWKNGALKRVPLPSGYTTGSVNAVNHFGLMVGTLFGPDKPPRAFRYWSDQASVQFYPQGTTATAVNNSGRATGYDADSRTGYEYWQGTQVRRTLSAGPDTRIFGVTGISDANRIIGWGYASNSAGDYATGLTWASSATAVATELQPVEPGNSYRSVTPRGIDNAGRIVGGDFFSRLGTGVGVYWPSAQQSQVAAPSLEGLNDTAFTAVSPSGFTVAGYAGAADYDYDPGEAPPDRAVIWRGSGPLTALPSLPSGGYAHANAISNGTRVGGFAIDSRAVARPVLWTCGSGT